MRALDLLEVRKLCDLYEIPLKTTPKVQLKATQDAVLKFRSVLCPLCVWTVCGDGVCVSCSESL